MNDTVKAAVFYFSYFPVLLILLMTWDDLIYDLSEKTKEKSTQTSVAVRHN